MKALIQRVSSASVSVDGECISSIGAGLLLLLGVERSDDDASIKKLADKVLAYRVFDDKQGKMNLSLLDTEGELLIVSQFTLVADTHKGLRPGFSKGASAEHGNLLYQRFIAYVEGTPISVSTGRFGSDMSVSLVNDGPVTFLLEVP
jgi:D-tyrosyl-tRNA(Tyr) deacylase